jgi:hypothetical protein
MALDDLAPELVSIIMRSLDYLQDLYSLIQASTACFWAFTSSRVIILSSVIRNALLPDVLYHAVSIVSTPVPSTGAKASLVGDVETFLDRYFSQPNSFRFPTDVSSIVSLACLPSRVSCFVDAYFGTARRALGISGCTIQGPNGTWPMSPTERARL